MQLYYILCYQPAGCMKYVQNIQFIYFLILKFYYNTNCYLKMDRNFSFETHHQQFPTLQSIDAQSEVSVDLRIQESDSLITKIFMLCLEVERKDKIIDQLQSQAEKDELKKSHIDITNKDLNMRYEKLMNEHRLLIENNGILKNSMMMMEKTIADMQVYKARAAYNQQLEDKVTLLALKLKQLEQQKIELVEREQVLRRENSMLSYSANKTVQKNRIRDLENELAQQKSKLDVERRQNADLKYQIQRHALQIKQVESNTIRIYEQKIQKIELIRKNQDLKQSQCTAANEEKIVLLSQEMNRLREELDYTRSMLNEEKKIGIGKDAQIKRLTQIIQSLDNQLKNSMKNYNILQQTSQKRQKQLIIQIQTHEKSAKNLKMTNIDMQNFIKQKASTENELHFEIQRLKQQLEAVTNDKNSLKAQVRKLKRQAIENKTGQCQICKIRSSVAIISSTKSIIEKIKPMDLEEIIRQTEKLNISNEKIESLLNHREISIQHSFEMRSNIQQSNVNMSQF